MHDELVALIKEARVSFPPFGKGVSQASIEQAESELGTPFPESFKWWLRNYGGGQIQGDIMYGLEDGNIGRPDIVQLAKDNERDGLYGKDRLVFCIGNCENFCFDTTSLDENGEYQIVLHEIDTDLEFPYADSFARFLDRRIRELYDV